MSVCFKTSNLINHVSYRTWTCPTTRWVPSVSVPCASPCATTQPSSLSTSLTTRQTLTQLWVKAFSFSELLSSDKKQRRFNRGIYNSVFACVFHSLVFHKWQLLHFVCIFYQTFQNLRLHCFERGIALYIISSKTFSEFMYLKFISHCAWLCTCRRAWGRCWRTTTPSSTWMSPATTWAKTSSPGRWDPPSKPTHVSKLWGMLKGYEKALMSGNFKTQFLAHVIMLCS